MAAEEEIEIRRLVGHACRMEERDHPEQLDELLSCRLDFGRKAVEPCSIVIFGASGDLTARKLIPALYHLFCEGQLPAPFRIIGFARREKSDDAFRQELLEYKVRPSSFETRRAEDGEIRTAMQGKGRGDEHRERPKNGPANRSDVTSARNG